MKYRTLLSVFLLLGTGSLAAGCFQELNPNAAKGGPPETPGPGEALDPGDGTIPASTDGFPILNPDGTEVADACTAVSAEAAAILQRSCAGCHSSQSGAEPMGLPPFDITNVDAMINLMPLAQLDDQNKPWRVLVPGQPDASFMVARILNGTMPKIQPPPSPQFPAPTLSDVSVLNQWIGVCLAPSAVATGGTGGTSGTGGNPGTGGTSGGTGGTTGTGGTVAATGGTTGTGGAAAAGGRTGGGGRAGRGGAGGG